MEYKFWYESKSVWTAIASVIIGIAGLFTGSFTPESALAFVIAGMGLYGIRDAMD